MSRLGARVARVLIMGCGLTLLVGGGLAPGRVHAEKGSDAGTQPCQLERSLKIIYQLMSDHKSPTTIGQQIDAAVQCPDADLDYDLALYQSLNLLARGDVQKARNAAERALNNGASDGQRDLARQLVAFLDPQVDSSQYYQVTFVLPDGTEAAVAVELGKEDPAAYAGETALAGLLGEELGFLATGIHKQMIQAARTQMTKGDSAPLRVWLPRGAYPLSTGQTLNADGPVQRLTFPVQELRWAKQTSSVGLGVLSLVPVSPDRIKLPFNVAGGLSFQHLRRLDGPNLLLSLEAGLYPVGNENSRCLWYGGESTAQGTCRWELGEQKVLPFGAYSLGVGISKPLLLTRDLPLLLGATIGGTGLPNSAFVYSTNSETGRIDSVSSPTAVASVQVQAQLLYWLKLKQVRGALSGGISGGIGEAILLPWPITEVTPEPEARQSPSEGGSEDTAENQFEFNDFPHQLFGSLALRLGGTLVF